MTLASCSGQVVTYRRSDGKRLWVYDVKADGTAQSFHGDMALWNEGLLVASDPADGYVYLFDHLSGDLRWKWYSRAGVSSDLFVLEGRVVLVTLDNELVSLDARTGTEIWKTEAFEGQRTIPVTSTPIAWGDDLLFARADGRISRHASETGEELWTFEVGAGASTDLVGFQDHVLCGLSDGRFIRFDPETGAVVSETALGDAPAYRWLLVNDRNLIGLTGIDGPSRRLVCLDTTTLETRWTLAPPDGESWTIAQAAMAWGHILVGSDGPALYAVDPESGVVSWQAWTDAPPRTVMVVDDHIYIGTFDGTLDAYRKSEPIDESEK